MAALMTSEQNDIDKISRDVKECKNLGIEVLPPDVNESFSGFAVVPQTGNIRFGLAAIKNVGSGIIKAIVSERKKSGKFTSLEDFLRRVPYNEMNRKVLETLIKSGAMDSFGKREEMLAGLDQILTYAQKIQKNLANGQIDLFGSLGQEAAFLVLPQVAELSREQKLAWEKELLGMYVSAHPLADFEDYLRRNTVSCANLENEKINQLVKIGGIITAIQRVITKSRQPMLFVTIEDTTGSVEVLVFPKVLERYPNFWIKDKMVLIEGRISVNKDGALKVVCQEAEELTLEKILSQNKFPTNRNCSRAVVINLPEGADINLFKKIQKILEQSKKGEDRIYLKIGDKKIKIPFRVNITSKLKTEIKNLLDKSKG